MIHEALIRAALDGKEVQYRRDSFSWRSFATRREAVAALAAEYGSWQFRLKPKDDVVEYRNIYRVPRATTAHTTLKECKDQQPLGSNHVAIEKLTFDGETGKLKSIELVKE